MYIFNLTVFFKARESFFSEKILGSVDVIRDIVINDQDPAKFSATEYIPTLVLDSRTARIRSESLV